MTASSGSHRRRYAPVAAAFLILALLVASTMDIVRIFQGFLP